MDDWDVNEHFEYLGCCEGDGQPKYYVLLDKNGLPLFTSQNRDDVIAEAEKRDVSNHHWVTVIPMKGVVLPLPPNNAK